MGAAKTVHCRKTPTVLSIRSVLRGGTVHMNVLYTLHMNVLYTHTCLYGECVRDRHSSTTPFKSSPSIPHVGMSLLYKKKGMKTPPNLSQDRKLPDS